MNETMKKELRQKCIDWLSVDAKRNQAGLARKTGVDKAYVSRIVNQNWTDTIPALSQWNKLANFFKVGIHINTANYLNIQNACKVAHLENNRIAVDGYTGAGKSYALDQYAKGHAHAYLITCRDSMSKRSFLREIGRQLGLSNISGPVYDLEMSIISKVESIDDHVLLIIDEIEYLKPTCYHSLKTIMQCLDGVCGFIVCGLFKDQLDKMASRNKPGMPQFRRRVGHSWLMMKPVSMEDIREVCKQVGITDRSAQKWLSTHVEDYDALTTYIRDLVRASERSKVRVNAQFCAELFCE